MRERVTEVGVEAFLDQGGMSKLDRVATEEPLELRIGGEALAVIMRTPGEDMDLAAGFLLAEQIVAQADDIELIKHCTTGDDSTQGNVVDVRLSPGRAQSAQSLLAQRKAERSTVTSASCGVCGKKSIESLAANCPPFEKAPTIDPELILSLPGKLRNSQAVFEQTGGLHAAAVFDLAGELLVVREDVGRHNAVDKSIGALLLQERLPIPGAILMVSGRSSFEIVQKAWVAGIATVAAVSAPSSLAIELANSAHMGLCGFVRGRSLNVYSGHLA